jgi:hypothetical protein
MTSVPIEALAASIADSLREAEAIIHAHEDGEREKLREQYGEKSALAEPFLASRRLHIRSCRVTVNADAIIENDKQHGGQPKLYMSAGKNRFKKSGKECSIEFNFDTDKSETPVS